jgi:predicted heme/steroid binding protein
MSNWAFAALGLSLALLLGGCAQDAAPEAATEPAAIETQDPGYGEMTAEPGMDEPVEMTETEPAESDETEASDQESASTAASPAASPSSAATASPRASSTESPAASPSPTASPSPSPTATATSTPESDPGFTLAEVAARNTASECWVAINGNVYDLTDWIAQHPGGESAITQLCGRDATSQFQGQHGGQSGPSSELRDRLLGPLRS